MSDAPAEGARNRLTRTLRDRWDVLVIVALAYVPVLGSAPGRMPSDTKLYLYLDPGRLVGDAPFSWDPRQFGGWVPHQTVSYLWPSGPWFWVGETVGLPDWIVHRLWLGTLLAAAGLGVRWFARHAGLAAPAALVAALAYQCSPYVLPYVSRTSLMLLPWAALGWLLGLTRRAALHGGWRGPAAIALVLATVGAPNATALLMVAPAPVLWLVSSVAQGDVTWRRAVAAAARIAVLSIGTALWWMGALSTQGAYGANVLGYSESLEAVSATARAPETIRGMGYWLAYVRDPFAATTTAALDYMGRPWLVATSFALAILGALGLAIVRWSQRRFAALLVLVGTVLAVGVYPIADPSPLMSRLAENSRSPAALALRSSTRALPMSVLGLALGLGALSAACVRALARNPRPRIRPVLVPAAAVGLVVLNLPVLWTFGFVDPALTRDQDVPSAWQDAAASLDAGPDGYRVLQLPGTEFGAYRWGYTVDPPLPGLTEVPLVTRDLLPLGTPGLMDLLFALDDRFQEGTIEAAAIAPVARMLGSATIAVTGDVAFERFRTPRPELVTALYGAQPPGLGAPRPFGAPTVNVPAVPVLDEQELAEPTIGSPVPPFELVDVLDPQPIIRAAIRTVVLDGSGDGLVDAAGAGLLDGSEVVRSAAALTPTQRHDAVGAADLVLVTDSNRRRAHQWRGSQDVVGFTEDDDPDVPDVLRPDPADQRLPLHGGSADGQTVAVQRGAVTARATAYGEPFAYRPEARAVMAIDGDPDTAWLVADRADPTGEAIELRSADPVADIVVHQPATTNRWIDGLLVVVDGSGPFAMDLDATSREPDGQRLALPVPGSTITLGVRSVRDEWQPGLEGPDAVGFTELTTGFAPTEEVVVLPDLVLSLDGGDRPLSVVLTRLRTRATNRWRADPEPALVRAFTLAAERSFTPRITARLHPRADDRTIAELLDLSGGTASSRLTGVPAAGGWAATDGDSGTAWQSSFGDATGASLTLAGSAPVEEIVVDVLDDDRHSAITALDVAPVADPTAAQRLTIPTGPGPHALTVEPPLPGPVSITIAEIGARLTRDRRYGEQTILPVGVAEIDLGSDGATALPTTVAIPCRNDLVTIDGAPVPVRLRGGVADLLRGGEFEVETCDGGPLVLGPGEHVVRSAAGHQSGIDIDRVVLTDLGPGSGSADDGSIPSTSSTGRTTRHIDVDPCPDGCWLVVGEGYNRGWAATIEGAALGGHEELAGGMSGWWLAPSDQPRTVHLRWTPQQRVTIGLAASAAAVAVCLGILWRTRRRRQADVFGDAPVLARIGERIGVVPAMAVAAAGAITATLVADPVAGAITALIGFGLLVVARRLRWFALSAVVAWSVVGAAVVSRVLRYEPEPGYGWLVAVSNVHRPALIGAVVLAAAAVVPRERGARADG